jgi:hypothetical protein
MLHTFFYKRDDDPVTVVQGTAEKRAIVEQQ